MRRMRPSGEREPPMLPMQGDPRRPTVPGDDDVEAEAAVRLLRRPASATARIEQDASCLFRKGKPACGVISKAGQWGYFESRRAEIQ